jgi:hypothetical protein
MKVQSGSYKIGVAHSMLFYFAETDASGVRKNFIYTI